MSLAWIQFATLLHAIHLVYAQDNGNTLPHTSSDFFASYSCRSADEVVENEENDSFFKWVLSARHTTWQPAGWEIDMPQDGKYYARVFDLLNYARVFDLLPVSVDIASICHKGSESQYIVPPKPNAHIPKEIWYDLWNTCNKQLLSTERTSNSCIDVPGVLIRNPDPPLKVNNPCHLEYRMVDGAHRLCLRKYLLALLTGELHHCENTMDNTCMHLENLIDQTTHGQYIVLNQTTFLSMLMSSDPHTSWARSEKHLMTDITKEMQMDWKKWMGRVMDCVWESKNENCGDACKAKEEL